MGNFLHVLLSFNSAILGNEFVYESLPLMISWLIWLKGGVTLSKGFEVPSPVFSYILLREKTGFTSKLEQLSIFVSVFDDGNR